MSKHLIWFCYAKDKAWDARRRQGERKLAKQIQIFVNAVYVHFTLIFQVKAWNHFLLLLSDILTRYLVVGTQQWLMEKRIDDGSTLITLLDAQALKTKAIHLKSRNYDQINI